MARKRNEARSIISEGGAAAVPVTRRRTSHVKAAQRVEPAQEPTVESNASLAPISEHEEIAKLAYSYWEARGQQHGSPEEDWLRAEQEFRRREASTS